MPINDAMFDSFSFVSENLMLLVHPNHRLADKREVSLSELVNKSFI